MLVEEIVQLDQNQTMLLKEEGVVEVNQVPQELEQQILAAAVEEILLVVDKLEVLELLLLDINFKINMYLLNFKINI